MSVTGGADRMSTDERAPAQTYEQVRAVLVEMRREDELELQRWERWVQLYATGAIPMPLSDSLEAVQTERDRRAADVAALSAAIDAIDRQNVDSALLDLMERHCVYPVPLLMSGWGLDWDADPEVSSLLLGMHVPPDGFTTVRDVLRAVKAVLGGQGAPKPS